MIKIRRNVFETNSSSTHCLAINRDVQYEIHEDLFLKEYVIKPWSENYQPPYLNSSRCKYDLELKTIEEKLTYFLTMYYQSNYSDYFASDWDNGSSFIKRLQKIFPNTVFALKCDESSHYVLEDGEYLFDEGRYGELHLLTALTDIQLKEFMEYGVIYFGDRDQESYSDFLDYELNNKHIIVKFSG
jgi:hypothetical protein